MGKYSNSNFGDISGKVGNAIGSNWRGIKYMRGLSSKRTKGASPLQLAQYAKFALAAAQLSIIKDVLSLGFNDKKLNKISGYNAAVKAFLSEAIVGDYPNFSVDYPKIRMSKGSLLHADISIVPETTAIDLSWPLELNEFNSFINDKMIFIIYNQTRNAYSLNTAHTRGSAGVSIPFPGRLNDVLHIWSFCVKGDGKTVSSSQYVGMVTVTEPS
ncbi:MAG: DUF6266 family protein [Bacteroidota bacterium]